MPRSLTMASDSRAWNWMALGLAVLGFALLDVYRVRYAGGCDSASYFVESLRLRGVDAGLGIDPAIPFKGALAPLCTELLPPATVVSFFPPGFPLILAIAGSVGLAYHATPFFAALGGLAIFVIAKERAHPAIALGAMAAWLSSPLVFFGGTQLMSDLPAATFLLLALVALRRERWFVAGLIVGISIGIRPTQVLFAPALLLFAPALAKQVRIFLGALLAVVGWALFLWFSLKTFSVPYTRNVEELTGELFRFQFAFLLRTTAWLHLPLVVLAIVGVFRAPRATLPYVVWFGTFLVFYSFWRAPFDAWWRARFLLPALPALVLGAAEGARALSEPAWLEKRSLAFGGVLLVAGTCLSGLFSTESKEVRETALDRRYPEDARRVAQVVPPNALVGAVNDSAPLRLYGRVSSFFWCHADTEHLIEWALDAQRPLYAVLDVAERTCVTSFDLSPLEQLPSGRTLFLIVPPVAVIDLGTPAARRFLLEGWSGNEHDGTATYVWATGRRARLSLPELPPTGDTRIRMTLSPFGAAPQQIELAVGTQTLGSFALTPGQQQIDVVLPAALSRGPLDLRFARATAPAPEGAPGDHRLLAAAVDRVTFRAAQNP